MITTTNDIQYFSKGDIIICSKTNNKSYQGIIGRIIKIHTIKDVLYYDIDVIYNPNRKVNWYTATIAYNRVELYANQRNFEYEELKALKKTDFFENFETDIEVTYLDSEELKMLKQLSDLNKQRKNLIKKITKKPKKNEC